jgi:hypothetical protein
MEIVTLFHKSVKIYLCQFALNPLILYCTITEAEPSVLSDYLTGWMARQLGFTSQWAQTHQIAVGPTQPAVLELFPQCETYLSPPCIGNLYLHSLYVFMVYHVLNPLMQNDLQRRCAVSPLKIKSPVKIYVKSQQIQ